MESFLLPRVSVSPKFCLTKSFDFTSKIALKKSFSFTPKIGLKKSIAAGQIVMARRGNEEASPDEKLALDVFTPKVEKTSDDFKILVIRKSHSEVTVSCGREFGWILGGILLGLLLKFVLSLGRGLKK